MIKEFNTSISYICPYCSSITVKDINVFSLASEAPNVFLCTDETGCDSICISIEPKKNTYEIVINCPICEDSHTFNINKYKFWQNDKPIVLRCPELGVGILFVGDHDTVFSMAENQESSLLAETGTPSMPHDLGLIFRTVEEINNLSKKDLVYCTCGSHSISIEIDSYSIVLSCRDCGQSKTFPLTEEELKKLLNASAIVLD